MTYYKLQCMQCLTYSEVLVGRAGDQGNVFGHFGARHCCCWYHCAVQLACVGVVVT